MFTKFGRDILFSADLCYNEDNEKPSSERQHSGARGMNDNTVTEGALGYAHELCPMPL